MAGGGWGGYHEGPESGSYSGSGSFTVSGLKGPATVSGTITCTFDDRGSVSAGPFGSCSCDGYDKSCSAAFSGVHVDPGETYSWSGSCQNDGGPYGGSFSASITSIKYDGCTSEITSDCTSRGLDYAKDSDNYCHCTGCSAAVIASCGSKGTKIVQNAEGKDVCVCDKECVEGGACRTSDGVKGEYDAACNCNPKCTPGGDCSKGGKTGTYNKDCECTGECEGGDKTCYGGGTWLKWPDCKCDCSTATPGEYACMKTAGGISFSDTDCSCFCADGQIVQGDGHCQCQQGAFCTTSECGKGHFETDCTCTCDCTVGGKCSVEGVPGHYNKYCECEKDCEPGASCSASDVPGTWVVENGECVCKNCGSDVECRTSDGVKGHQNQWCTCIADCSYPGSCSYETESGTSTGTLNKDCGCDCEHPLKSPCTAKSSTGADVPGEGDANCQCVAKCEPGEACDAGGGKTGVYDAECNCVCEGQSCAMGTEGGKTDSNCNCYCDKVGNPCKIGEEDGIVDENCNCKCAVEGQPCVLGTEGGEFDDKCECQCTKEGDPCMPSGWEKPGTVDPDCNCYCTYQGMQCTLESGVSAKYNESCKCECVDDEHPEKEDCGSGKRWSHGKCKCECVNDEEAKDACENTGDPVWDENHTWNPETCNCDCNDAGAADCDPLYGEWRHEQCSCFCIEGAEELCTADGKHTFDDYPSCTCKCTDTAAEDKCKNGATPGTWDDYYCTCSCPEKSKLVDGECKCENEATEKPKCEERGAEWKPAVCNCCDNEEFWKESCEADIWKIEGKATGSWDKDRCECKCVEPYVKVMGHCQCDKEAEKKCPTESGYASFDKTTCKCACDSEDAVALKEACMASEATASGASWDETECKCKCLGDKQTFDGTKCVCGNTEDIQECNKLKALKPEAVAWNNETCKCYCIYDLTDGLPCTLPGGGEGEYEKCACKCKKKGQSCGPGGMVYNDKCKCECPSDSVGKSCTITTKDDGVINKYCRCKCKGKKGTTCTIKTEGDGKTNDKCECICNQVGKPCKYKDKEGVEHTGKTWKDCTCACEQAGAPCANPEKNPGGVGWIDPATCTCQCAPDGTKCVQSNGNIGVVKGCECAECPEKEKEDCLDKITPDTPWIWNPTGCSCDCGLNAAICEADDMAFDKKNCKCNEKCTAEQQQICHDKKQVINHETCDCEDCDQSLVLCIPSATINDKTCECECKEEVLGECETGKHHSPEMGCQCVCDKDENNCKEEGDGKVWNKQTCKCECSEAEIKKYKGRDYCKKGHLDDDCQCVCDQDEDDCDPELQYFDENTCECKCNQTDVNCPTGKRRNKKTCKCECKKDESMCDKDIQTWDAENCKCVCREDVIKCDPGEHLNENCKCVCDKDESMCDISKQMWNEDKCDCECLQTLVSDCKAQGATLDSKCNCKKCEPDPDCQGTQGTWEEGCPCKCTTAQISSCTSSNGAGWELDANCNCYCNKSASSCKEGEVFVANSCICQCLRECTDPATPHLDPATCTCICNPSLIPGAPDCEGRGFDFGTCSCIPCDPDKRPSPPECPDPACRTFDTTICEWKCSTEEWEAMYTAWVADLNSKLNVATGPCDGLGLIGDIPYPGDKGIECCADNDYDYVEIIYSAAEEQVTAASNICAGLTGYVNSINSLLAATYECPNELPSADDPPDVSGAASHIQAALNYAAQLRNIANCARIRINPVTHLEECI